MVDNIEKKGKYIFFVILLTLIPFVLFGHSRKYLGEIGSFVFYISFHFLAGVVVRVYLSEKKYVHLIPISGVILYFLHLLSMKSIYFPLYIPTLSIMGLLAYVLGWKSKYFTWTKTLTLSGLLLLSSCIWCQIVIPIILFKNSYNIPEYHYLLGKQVDIQLQDMKGNSLGDSLKGKVVVLDLWFSRCGYCFDKFPFYDMLYEKYRDNPDIVVATVVPGNIDTKKDIEKVLKLHPLSAPVFYDSAGVTINRYQLAKYGYPNEIRMDKNGVIREVISGSVGDIVAEIYLERSIKSINNYLRE